jgi:ribonuclease VapC
VLDASAVLAFLFEEPGAATVQDAIGRSLISTVNWAEVAQACIGRDADPIAARTALTAVGLELVPLDVTDAEAAAAMRTATRASGLSLADRCCLAVAARHRLPALTADFAWADVATPAKVVLIR